MEHVNLSDASTNLAELVRRAAHGEEIIIAESGVPQARLVPLDPLTLAPALGMRKPGRLKGLLMETPDFDLTKKESVATGQVEQILALLNSAEFQRPPCRTPEEMEEIIQSNRRAWEK
ncbi:MAG: type II toxin-antitoxin system prevent-host-death family antitoxin [Magnetococcales bacterium]|nr:type II toxin-antitoxin system prevent-host-death family antitoxin [Magnetococcales bacterium]